MAQRGARNTFGCNGRAKCGCTWQLTLEFTEEGWVVQNTHALHTGHMLPTTLAESNATAQLRFIPEQYLQQAKSMVAGGCITVGKTNHWMQQQARADGIQVTWTYQDLYTATSASTAARLLDATAFIEMLTARTKTDGLYHSYTTDEDGALNKGFFVMAGAVDRWAVGGDANVVIYDTTVRRD